MPGIYARAVALASFILVTCLVHTAHASSIVYSIEVTLETDAGERNTQIVHVHAGETVSQAVTTFCSSGICGDSQQAVDDYVQSVVDNARKNLYVNEVLQKSIETATVYDERNQAVPLDSNVAANEGKYLYDLIIDTSHRSSDGCVCVASAEHPIPPSKASLTIETFLRFCWP